MKIEGYVACICEGSAEQAVMELLLENDRLIFCADRLLDGEIIRCRDAKKFEARYLRKEFDDKITVLRILDSRKENFNLSKAYAEKISVIDIITAPEIEMLIVIKEGKYDEYKRSGIKPSEFCKGRLKFKEVKSYKFVNEYFSDIDELIKCIREYKRLKKVIKGEHTLCDVIKK